MIDVVYPLTGNHKIIRYSLRGLNNIPFTGKVWIIGTLPVWCTREVNHIPMNDPYKHKQKNVIEKLITLCQNPLVSEEFLYMNDDFIFLKEGMNPFETTFVFKTLPEIDPEPRSKYIHSMNRTIELLRDNKRKQNYETHYPMMINKKKFLKTMKNTDWEEQPMLYRSLYANLNPHQKTEIIQQDFKIYNSNDWQRLIKSPYISTSPKLERSKNFRDWIETHLPTKTKYEN
jgi:hypothetical protein